MFVFVRTWVNNVYLCACTVCLCVSDCVICLCVCVACLVVYVVNIDERERPEYIDPYSSWPPPIIDNIQVYY